MPAACQDGLGRTAGGPRRKKLGVRLNPFAPMSALWVEQKGGRMQPDDERGFEDFVTARRAELVRTAFLLCGDPHEAHDLVQVALMRVHRRWRSITRTDAPEVYARKIVVNLTASWWRR